MSEFEGGLTGMTLCQSDEPGIQSGLTWLSVMKVGQR